VNAAGGPDNVSCAVADLVPWTPWSPADSPAQSRARDRGTGQQTMKPGGGDAVCATAARVTRLAGTGQRTVKGAEACSPSVATAMSRWDPAATDAGMVAVTVKLPARFVTVTPVGSGVPLA
jgi:hypothetical protein